MIWDACYHGNIAVDCFTCYIRKMFPMGNKEDDNYLERLVQILWPI